MAKKEGYKAHRPTARQVNEEYRRCQEKLYLERQYKVNQQRIKEGLEPLEIEPYPTFARITPEFWAGYNLLVEKAAKEQAELEASKATTTNDQSTNSEGLVDA